MASKRSDQLVRPAKREQSGMIAAVVNNRQQASVADFGRALERSHNVDEGQPPVAPGTARFHLSDRTAGGWDHLVEDISGAFDRQSIVGGVTGRPYIEWAQIGRAA